MSLFPAYSEDVNTPQNSTVTSNVKDDDGSGALPIPGSWLENASFSVNLSEIPLPPEREPEIAKEEEVVQLHSPEHSPPLARKRNKSSSHKKKSKKHEHKRKRTEHSVIPVLEENENFYEDKSSARGNLSVKTLSRPAVPLYRSRFYLGRPSFRPRSHKKKINKRYYVEVLRLPEVEEEEDKESIDKLTKQSESEVNNTLEDELSKKTAEFNKSLTKDPRNVEMWLKYVRYQDVVWQFERTYRRGGGAKGMRVTAERKLSILDKALESNSGSPALLQERFSVAENVLPADTLSKQLATLLEGQPSCVPLWRGYIRTNQYSLSLCSAHSVIKLYEQGMMRLHQLRRGAPAARTRPMEDGILDLFLDCGLFLRQAGLWEMLWTLIRLYLELNLAQPDTDLFQFRSTLSEEYITELEETILRSQLPLTELWYRVERLRESSHWLPWSSKADCEDPQRLVFPDDVSDMLHPITTPGLNFRLALIALTLLKVPLLPCRNSALQFIGLDQVPWYVDCIETMLPIFYPVGTLEMKDPTLFQDVSKLVHGPQYLLDHWPGQEQYLDFVAHTFKSCAKCLSEPARTALNIWWLRFERFLLILNRHGHCKIPLNRKKKIKSMVKEFLKQEENRNNGLYYLEYALVEWELGQRESACKILETAIKTQQGGMFLMSIVCDRQKAELCRLYRTLCELLLAGMVNDVSNAKNKTVSVLIALSVSSLQVDSETEPTNLQISTATDKYHHITTELLAHVDRSVVANGTEHLLPDFIVEWVTCHAWFLYLVSTTWAAAAVFEDALKHIPPSSSADRAPVTVNCCQREALFESYVAMLLHHCQSSATSYGVLQDVLHLALREFPNNLYFLSTIANIETGLGCIGSSWWKLSQYFSESSSLLAQVFRVFLAKQKQTQLQEAHLQSHTFLSTGGPVILCPSGNNRLASLFKQLLSLPASKRCPLLWRLHLQFLAEQGGEKSYHSAFYRAVEDCPWVKVLYLEATKLLPAELPQLQDLLLEKELRVHVTPEELDILRSDD